MANGITSVVFEDSWGTSPARINRYTGETHINKAYLPRIKNPNHWYFILGHEKTHAAENTMSEFVADAGASALYFKDGRSPKDSVTALADVLSFTSPDHLVRVREQFKRAAKHDCEVNGHKASCDMVAAIEKYNRENTREFNFADFCGPICKAKQRKAAKLQNAINNALANSTVMTQAATAAVINASNQQQQNNPPAPAAQQNSPAQPGGGGQGPASPDDGGDDGSDDGSFSGWVPLAGLAANFAFTSAQQKQVNVMDAFCGPLCEAAKAKNARKEQESHDKLAIAQAQTAAQVEIEKEDNKQKAKEAEVAAKQTEAVAKSLQDENKSDNKSGSLIPVVAGIILLLAVGVVFYLKSKKGKAGIKPPVPAI